MLLGVIADDLTGATDIAGFLSNNGLDTIQLMGEPGEESAADAEAVVISLKSRSTPAEEAVSSSLSALKWLRRTGCAQIYFKYCSTFDSTARGNIGPVTDALLGALESQFTVVCPTLPVNGRVIKDGVLLVNGVPLSETGMRHHPVTPMTESNLLNLMEMQSKGKAGLVDLATVERGTDAVVEKLAALKRSGINYAVLDSTTDRHLDTLAAALDDFPLLTGGSGLGAARARRFRTKAKAPGGNDRRGHPPGGRVIVLSGSCSEMTNRQVEAYRKSADSIKISVSHSIRDPEGYTAELAAWAEEHSGKSLAPMIYATANKRELAEIQAEFGAAESSAAVEKLFTRLARTLSDRGFDHFIVAGGETSGAATLALGEKAFRLGPEIAPGVPWIRALDRPLFMALKSGNFGDERFFFKAQELIG